jgi:hypothetical protein
MSVDKLFLNKDVKNNQGAAKVTNIEKPKDGQSMFDMMLSDMTKKTSKETSDTNLGTSSKKSNLPNTTSKDDISKTIKTKENKPFVNINETKLVNDKLKAFKSDKTDNVELKEITQDKTKKSSGSLLDKLMQDAKKIVDSGAVEKDIKKELLPSKEKIIGTLSDIDIVDTKSKDIKKETKPASSKFVDGLINKTDKPEESAKQSLQELFENIKKLKQKDTEDDEKSTKSKKEIVNDSKSIKTVELKDENKQEKTTITQKSSIEVEDKKTIKDKLETKKDSKYIISELDAKEVSDEKQKYKQNSQTVTTDDVIDIKKQTKDIKHSKDYTISKEKITDAKIISEDTVSTSQIDTKVEKNLSKQTLVSESDTKDGSKRLIDRLIDESQVILKENRVSDKKDINQDISLNIYDSKKRQLSDLEITKRLSQANDILKNGKSESDVKKAGDLMGLNVQNVTSSQKQQKQALSTVKTDEKVLKEQAIVDKKNQQDNLLNRIIIDKSEKNDLVKQDVISKVIAKQQEVTHSSITQSLLASNKITSDMVTNDKLVTSILNNQNLPTTELSVSQNTAQQFLTQKIVTARQTHQSFLSDLAKQMYENYKPPVTAFKIALNPASLGHISILMKKVGNDMNINITSSRRNTLDSLLDLKEYLKEALGDSFNDDTNFVLNFHSDMKDNSEGSLANSETFTDETTDSRVDNEEIDTDLVDFLQLLNPLAMSTEDRLRNIGSDTM